MRAARTRRSEERRVPRVERVLAPANRAGARPLEHAVAAPFSQRFGHDFSRVRIHTSSEAAESARELNAAAYTVGRDIVFAAGRYTPQTSEGASLLAHELVHVAQQNREATPREVSRLARSSESAEREAEHFAAGAATGTPSVSSEPVIALAPPVRKQPPTPLGFPRLDLSAANKAIDKAAKGEALLTAIYANLDVPDRYQPAVAKYIIKTVLPERLSLWRGERPQPAGPAAGLGLSPNFMRDLAVDYTVDAVIGVLKIHPVGKLLLMIGSAALLDLLRQPKPSEKLAECQQVVLDSRYNELASRVDIAIRKVLGKGARDTSTPEELAKQIRGDELEKTRTRRDNTTVVIPKGGFPK